VADVEEEDRHHPLGRIVLAWAIGQQHPPRR
jgi:hypothetical protein